MNPIPVPKSTELIVRLRHIDESLMSEFQLAGIERDARNLLKTDATGAWHVLALVATHRGDETSMREAFREAINRDKANLLIQGNFSKALFRMGYYRESLNIMLPLIDRDPTEISFIKHAIRSALRTGSFFVANDLTSRLRKLNAEPDFEVADIVAALKHAKVDDAKVGARADIVGELIRKRGCKVTSFTYELIGEVAALRYKIAAEPETVAAVNEEIATELCRRFDDPLHGAVIFGCRPA